MLLPEQSGQLQKLAIRGCKVGIDLINSIVASDIMGRLSSFEISNNLLCVEEMQPFFENLTVSNL